MQSAMANVLTLHCMPADPWPHILRTLVSPSGATASASRGTLERGDVMTVEASGSGAVELRAGPDTRLTCAYECGPSVESVRMTLCVRNREQKEEIVSAALSESMKVAGAAGGTFSLASRIAAGPE
jgi:hypothetical protein